MNFMAGTLEEGRLRTGLGDLPLTARQRQALEAAGTGREVIVGIRPETFEDASLVSADLRPSGLEFSATIDVVESLGSDKFLYFTQELGHAANVAELEELARDSGRADIGGATETVVARLDPASRITEGEGARLWVDVRTMHIFDPVSHRNLTLGDGTAATGPAGPVAAGTAEADARPAQPTTADPARGTIAPPSP
jgi:multiple sugar transport system ATP-binding protein